jgi:uncharacterized membrane protein YjfL (UPF0719 family)
MGGAEVLVSRFVTYIINPAILLVIAAGFFLFVWGLVQFLLHLDEGTQREESLKHMLWGIVGMVVMFSVYGIVQLLDSTFSLQVFNPNPPDVSAIQNMQLNENLFRGGGR